MKGRPKFSDCHIARGVEIVCTESLLLLIKYIKLVDYFYHDKKDSLLRGTCCRAYAYNYAQTKLKNRYMARCPKTAPANDFPLILR
jgi:hypothetical protein